MCGEPRPQMLRGHAPALPLQPVQMQHAVDRDGHFPGQYGAFLDAQRVELAQLGADPAGAVAGQPAQQAVHRHAGQLQADRVVAPAARPGPGRVQPLGGRAGPHLAQIHEGAAGRPVQPGGERLGRRTGAGVVQQDVTEVREGPPSGTSTGSGRYASISGAAATSRPARRTSTMRSRPGVPYDSHHEYSQEWLWNGVAARQPRCSARQSAARAAN